MDEDLDAVVGPNAVGVAGVHGGHHGARHRGAHVAVGGDDADAVAQRPGGEDGVGHLLQGRGGAGHGRGQGGGGLGVRRGRRRGRALRPAVHGVVLDPEEEGEGEGDKDGEDDAEGPQGEVRGLEVGGQPDEGREDPGLGDAASGDGPDGAADGAADDTEVEGELARQVDTVDRGLGHAGQEPGQGRRPGEPLRLLVPGADHDGEGRGGLGEDSRLDRAVVDQGVAVGRDLLGHNRHEAPVQAEHDEDLPEPADDDPADDGDGDEEPLDAGGDAVGDDRGHRADREQGERDHNEDRDPRRHEVAEGAGNIAVAAALDVALDPHRDNDREHRRRVAHNDERDTHEGV